MLLEYFFIKTVLVLDTYIIALCNYFVTDILVTYVFKVTIFGESAGGQSITYHLMSNKSRKLFKRAIVQSNPLFYRFPTKDEAIMRTTKSLFASLNCTESVYQCLK